VIWNNLIGSYNDLGFFNEMYNSLIEIKMSIKELLEVYYQAFSAKSDFGSVLADDFEYTGGDMSNPRTLVGKAAYIEVINRFSQLFKSMKVEKMIIQKESACVIGNYDFIFPNGKHINGNVAEIWAAENGKLKSLTIYFDTLTFANNSKN
jgi:ketosteroid isomerase-like protein